MYSGFYANISLLLFCQSMVPRGGIDFDQYVVAPVYIKNQLPDNVMSICINEANHGINEYELHTLCVVT